MTDQVFIQRRFTTVKDGLTFSDALVMLIQEYSPLTEQEIDLLKKKRFDDWKEVITHPVQVPLLSVSEQLATIAADKKSLLEQFDILTARELELKGGK